MNRSISLSVRLPDGRTVSLQLPRSSTIDAVKSSLLKKSDIKFDVAEYHLTKETGEALTAEFVPILRAMGGQEDNITLVLAKNTSKSVDTYSSTYIQIPRQKKLLEREEAVARRERELQEYADKLEQKEKELKQFQEKLYAMQKELQDRELKMRGLTDQDRLNFLESIEAEVVAVMERHIKGYLVRNKWRALAKETQMSQNKVFSCLRKRAAVLKEIIETERVYVASLTRLQEQMVMPLYSSKIVGPQEVNQMFLAPEIEGILNISRGFLNDFKARFAEWPTKQVFSDLFANLAPMLKVYVKFVENYGYSHDNRQKMCKHNRALSNFIETHQENLGGLDVQSFLIQPIQRLPRYEILLKELYKDTPKGHSDKEDLKKSLDKIVEMVAFLDTRQRQAELKRRFGTVVERQIKALKKDEAKKAMAVAEESDIGSGGFLLTILYAEGFPEDTNQPVIQAALGPNQIWKTKADKKCAWNTEFGFFLGDGNILVLQFLEFNRRSGKIEGVIGTAQVPIDEIKDKYDGEEDVAILMQKGDAEEMECVVHVTFGYIHSSARATINVKQSKPKMEEEQLSDEGDRPASPMLSLAGTDRTMSGEGLGSREGTDSEREDEHDSAGEGNRPKSRSKKSKRDKRKEDRKKKKERKRFATLRYAEAFSVRKKDKGKKGSRNRGTTTSREPASERYPATPVALTGLGSTSAPQRRSSVGEQTSSSLDAIDRSESELAKAKSKVHNNDLNIVVDPPEATEPAVVPENSNGTQGHFSEGEEMPVVTPPRAAEHEGSPGQGETDDGKDSDKITNGNKSSAQKSPPPVPAKQKPVVPARPRVPIAPRQKGTTIGSARVSSAENILTANKQRGEGRPGRGRGARGARGGRAARVRGLRGSASWDSRGIRGRGGLKPRARGGRGAGKAQ